MKNKTFYFTLVLMGLLAGSCPSTKAQGGWVVGWGYNLNGETTGVNPFASCTNDAEWWSRRTNELFIISRGATVTLDSQVLSDINAIRAGRSGSFGIRTNGQLVGWGLVEWLQRAMPTNLANVVSVAVGWSHALALRQDGTVVALGGDKRDLSVVTVPPGLSNVVAVAAGANCSLALKQDGTLVGWGKNVRLPEGLNHITAISMYPGAIFGINASRRGSFLALKDDGTVWKVGWGSGEDCYIHPQAGVSNAVAIVDTLGLSLALKKDGTVTAWGLTNTPVVKNLPPGLTNVVAIAASGDMLPVTSSALALKSDGTVVGWGTRNAAPTYVPEGLSNVVAISMGDGYCLAITTNAAVAERFRQK